MERRSFRLRNETLTGDGFAILDARGNTVARTWRMDRADALVATLNDDMGPQSRRVDASASPSPMATSREARPAICTCEGTGAPSRPEDLFCMVCGPVIRPALRVVVGGRDARRRA